MRKALLAAAAALVLVFAACDTEAPTDVTYDSATVEVRVGCHDTRGESMGEYDAQWRVAYREVGATGWQHTTWRDYLCPDETEAHYLAGSPFAEQLDDLDYSTDYEYRAEFQHPSGASFEWRDADAVQNGTNYDGFTTDPFPQETPKAAGAFRDSQGLNSRLAFSGSPWDNLNAVKFAAVWTGIGHLRETWRVQRLAQYRDLAQYGVTFTFGLGELDPDHDDVCGPWQIDQLLAEMRSDPVVRAAIKYIESPNEINGSDGEQGIVDWDECTRDFLAAQHTAVDGEWPIVAPTVMGWPSAHQELGNIEQWVDLGNMHPYPGGLAPDIPDPAFNAIDFNLPHAQALTGDLPVQATETGYHTTLSNPHPNAPVPEDVQSPYMLRLFLEYFRRGIQHTDIYAIVDHECGDPFTWGIYRCDWTAKPVVAALHNLNATAGDGAPALTPLAMRVVQAPSDLRQLLLRRSDGKYVLALWRAASLWDRTGDGSPITVTPESVQVALPEAASVKAVWPVDSATEQPLTIFGGGVSVDIAGAPVLLVVEPS